MKKIGVLLLIIFVSCSKRIEPQDIQKINGYWEIEKAIDADGEVKDYKVNPMIDYFQIKDNQGFRKKVMPQFDGKYLTNKDFEKIKIIKKNDKFYIDYSTEFANWKEEIVEILDIKLVLKNEQGVEYYYKRPTPFSVK